uniref:hypothetical protein n=1 Tax=Nesterenkonia massiliensis TaxID=1232429 RepID=UPI001315153C
ATVIDIPLHTGPVSSSLPAGGLDDEYDDAAEARLIRGLSDEQIQQQCRLRVINLSPELLNPAAAETAAL